MTPSRLPASGQNLLLSEKFVSLQGEGISQGVPAAFLRLGNCNLTCTYCDTPYSWDASRYDLQTELTTASLQDTAIWITENAPGRLIITGGEPLLQQKLLIKLLAKVDVLIVQRKTTPLIVEVETNGTLKPSPSLLSRVNQWNVSPKLTCSGETRKRRIVPDVLRAFKNSELAYFKFVLTNESDLHEVETLIEEFHLPKTRVILMPEARTPVELKSRAPQVAKWALRSGFRYSGRLHLELYGDTRGT